MPFKTKNVKNIKHMQDHVTFLQEMFILLT